MRFRRAPDVSLALRLARRGRLYFVKEKQSLVAAMDELHVAASGALEPTTRQSCTSLLGELKKDDDGKVDDSSPARMPRGRSPTSHGESCSPLLL
eukprot:CAMPEP_0178567424 /NCGR_PEP_ID=MMETSP0697-20121206/15320_1 /TAXON_ID=265572 /ORGANISM="Extubocellulus spinifer, Strain CCMP396" /LENGTH=94 /DNA_ID=CAMNT_0020201361 /DNA_START=675 /DNA_END=959 /DNA_ORIENTATION=+